MLSAWSFFAFGFLLASLAPTAQVGMALCYPMFFPAGAAIPREILPTTFFLFTVDSRSYLIAQFMGWSGTKYHIEVLI